MPIDTYIRQPGPRPPVTSAPQEIFDFHRRMSGYDPTALRECSSLAKSLGVGRVFIKEEACRFGLPSFKMVGASWAIYRTLVAQTAEPEREWSFAELSALFGGDHGLTLICATDGNHGRAVAHMAALLGLSARVFVPNQIGQRAKHDIRSEGAELTEIDHPYDEVVRVAAATADADPHAIMIQDTAWDDYKQIPSWIVEGYSTIFREIDAQLEVAGVSSPDVVVTPCGVGSLIQATVAHYRGNDYSKAQSKPALVSVESEVSACLVASLHADARVSVTTGKTRMAGLNCGTVSTIAWPVLRHGIDVAVAISEEDDERAAQELQQLGIDSGPCGAASLAGVRKALSNDEARRSINVSSDSVIVLMSTESRDANPLNQ